MAHRESGLLGGIVAFEGRPDTISTQLRLLPTSSQVLILPSVQCYLPVDVAERAFDTRGYIRDVHDATMARNDAARTFLQGSTTAHKRLVFMNGGTPSVHALCIKAIMENETAGNQEEARAIFDNLVTEGLSGLMSLKRSTFGYTCDDHQARGDFEDPITRAMRAADALDRQTANLQPADLTAFTRQRSSSLPMYGYSDEFGDAAPFFVFGARRDSQAEEVNSSTAAAALGLAHMQLDEPSHKPDRLSTSSTAPRPRSPSCVGETYEPLLVQGRSDTDVASPISDVFSIRTQENVVYGEAALLDVRPAASKAPLTRVRSLDRIYPASPKYRDMGIPSESWPNEPEVGKIKSIRSQSLMLSAGDKDRLSRLSTVERPRTIMVKPNLPVVKMAPVPQSKKKAQGPLSKPTYIDRGTDTTAALPRKLPNQLLFACMEDLVVYMKEEASDSVLEAAVNASKEERLPLSAHSPTAWEPDHADKPSPATPQSPRSAGDAAVSAFGLPLGDQEASAAASCAAPATGKDADYDPFPFTQSAWSSRKISYVAPKVTIVRPPTPAQTPPPSATVVEQEQKFHEFIIAPNQTAVTVQNSLRSILGEYFPPDTEGYHQFQFSLLPELDGLWKPIFRAPDHGGSQLSEGRVHQILAIGSQQGVRKEYSSAITARLERLGSQSSSVGCADRLDFRYLLANAMQAFTAQPLANQTSDNPFTNPYLLATLIVPHLETYLVLHSEVQYLLLQYPPEHFKTMLALQKLVGVDLMKIAQIVDPDGKDQLPFTHIRGASLGNKAEASPGKRSTPSPRSTTDTPVSKANYLLTSTASDKDIVTFVSTVWNISTNVSDSDGPELSTPVSKRNARPSPLSLRGDAMSTLPNGDLQSPISPKTVLPMPAVPVSPTTTLRPTSAAETMNTVKSGRSRRGAKGNVQADVVSIMTYDPNDDSDLDIEERRLMPMFMRRTSTIKPNSRKALKFLGLA